MASSTSPQKKQVDDDLGNYLPSITLSIDIITVEFIEQVAGV